MEEGGGVVGADGLAGLVADQDLGLDDRALAFAPVIDVDDLVLPLEGALDGIDGLVPDDLVIHVQESDRGLDDLICQHGSRKGHPLIGFDIDSSPVRDGPIGGDGLEVLLIGIHQVFFLGADGQRIEGDIAPVVLHVAGLHFLSDQ